MPAIDIPMTRNERVTYRFSSSRSCILFSLYTPYKPRAQPTTHEHLTSNISSVNNTRHPLSPSSSLSRHPSSLSPHLSSPLHNNPLYQSPIYLHSSHHHQNHVRTTLHNEPSSPVSLTHHAHHGASRSALPQSIRPTEPLEWCACGSGGLGSTVLCTVLGSPAVLYVRAPSPALVPCLCPQPRMGPNIGREDDYRYTN